MTAHSWMLRVSGMSSDNALTYARPLPLDVGCNAFCIMRAGAAAAVAAAGTSGSQQQHAAAQAAGLAHQSSQVGSPWQPHNPSQPKQTWGCYCSSYSHSITKRKPQPHPATQPAVTRPGDSNGLFAQEAAPCCNSSGQTAYCQCAAAGHSRSRCLVCRLGGCPAAYQATV